MEDVAEEEAREEAAHEEEMKSDCSADPLQYPDLSDEADLEGMGEIEVDGGIQFYPLSEDEEEMDQGEHYIQAKQAAKGHGKGSKSKE